LPDEILAFARRYGVLGLCRHGLPINHRSKVERFRRSGPLRRTLLRQVEGCDLNVRRFRGGFAEPIKNWKALAGAADALMKLKADSRKAIPELRFEECQHLGSPEWTA